MLYARRSRVFFREALEGVAADIPHLPMNTGECHPTLTRGKEPVAVMKQNYVDIMYCMRGFIHWASYKESRPGFSSSIVESAPMSTTVLSPVAEGSAL